MHKIDFPWFAGGLLGGVVLTILMLSPFLAQSTHRKDKDQTQLADYEIGDGTALATTTTGVYLPYVLGYNPLDSMRRRAR